MRKFIKQVEKVCLDAVDDVVREVLVLKSVLCKHKKDIKKCKETDCKSQKTDAN